MSGSTVDPGPVILFVELQNNARGSLPPWFCPRPYMESAQGFQAGGWPLLRALLLPGSWPLIFISLAPCRRLPEALSGYLLCVPTFAFKSVKLPGKTNPWCQMGFFAWELGPWGPAFAGSSQPSLITPDFSASLPLSSVPLSSLLPCAPAPMQKCHIEYQAHFNSSSFDSPVLWKKKFFFSFVYLAGFYSCSRWESWASRSYAIMAPSGKALGENVKYKIDLWFYNYEKLNVNMGKDPKMIVQIKAFI